MYRLGSGILDTFNLLQERAYMALLITMSEADQRKDKAKIEPCRGHEYNVEEGDEYGNVDTD